jgi:hypothetical protein
MTSLAPSSPLPETFSPVLRDGTDEIRVSRTETLMVQAIRQLWPERQRQLIDQMVQGYETPLHEEANKSYARYLVDINLNELAVRLVIFGDEGLTHEVCERLGFDGPRLRSKIEEVSPLVKAAGERTAYVVSFVIEGDPSGREFEQRVLAKNGVDAALYFGGAFPEWRFRRVRQALSENDGL